MKNTRRFCSIFFVYFMFFFLFFTPSKPRREHKISNNCSIFCNHADFLQGVVIQKTLKKKQKKHEKHQILDDFSKVSPEDLPPRILGNFLKVSSKTWTVFFYEKMKIISERTRFEHNGGGLILKRKKNRFWTFWLM